MSAPSDGRHDAAGPPGAGADADQQARHTAAWQLVTAGRHREALAAYRPVAAEYLARADYDTAVSCLGVISQLYRFLGRLEEAIAAAEEATGLADRATDPRGRFDAWDALADALSAAGRDQDALPAAERAAAEADTTGDPEVRCLSRVGTGNVLASLDRNADALEAYEQAVRLALTPHLLMRAATRQEALRLTGLHLTNMGRLTDAVRHLELALELADGAATAGSALLRNLGVVYQKLGRFPDAERCLRAAAAAVADGDNPTERCQAFERLGTFLAHQLRFDEALEWLTQAAVVARELTDPGVRIDIGTSVGNMLIGAGMPRAALPWLEEAFELVGDATPPGRAYRVQRALADAHSRTGDHDGAVVWIERATPAAHAAAEAGDPECLRNLAYTRGLIHFRRDEWKPGLAALAEARDRLFAAWATNPEPHAVGHLSATYAPLFREAVRVAGRTDPWDGLPFIDGAKCVAIRNALDRTAGRAGAAEPVPWEAGGHEAMTDPAEPSLPPVPVRGVHGAASSGSAAAVTAPLEYPVEPDPEKNEYCRPIDRAELAELLPDSRTVLVQYFFADDDLFVVPIRRREGGELAVLGDDGGYFRIPGVLARLREVLDRLSRSVEATRAHLFRTAPAVGPLPDELSLTPACVELYHLLEWDEVWDLIGRHGGRDGVHLVLVPDGPLYLAPVHAAAASPGGPRLYEQAASVRYGLSLRTLALQQVIDARRRPEEPAGRELRGVVFANPDAGTVAVDGRQYSRRLAGVPAEVAALAAATGPDRWWVHGDRPGDRQATRDRFKARHTAGNVGWVIAHGGSGHPEFDDTVRLPDGSEATVREPSFRLCDGPVSMSRLLRDGYDFSRWELFHLSACLLGELNTLGASREVLGYTAVLTLLGCRRVVSSLWELADGAAVGFAARWAGTLDRDVFGPGRAREPHRFAEALAAATTAFRRDHPELDYEFYWAGYTLYGLG
ncbi:MAG TPA: CHAT domain-containing protein [Urbifossiella sp.]|nr:CHAT domain-containing protein [Urbifossiella sp.]